MRPIWTGMIAFGLVNIPVKLYSPSKEEKIDLDLLHKKDKSPIRYARICKHEEREVPWEDIVRGYSINDTYVVLTKQDFEKANARKTSTVDIVHFAREEEIDPVYYEKPYYLEPKEGAGRAYALLRSALQKTGYVGVATFVLRSREHVAVVKPYGDVLVLNQLRFAGDVASGDQLIVPKQVKQSAKEIKMAVDLIQASVEPFQPEKFKNTYLRELRAIIRQKSKGLKPKARGARPEPTQAGDLMLELQKSLQYASTRH